MASNIIMVVVGYLGTVVNNCLVERNFFLFVERWECEWDGRLSSVCNKMCVYGYVCMFSEGSFRVEDDKRKVTTSRKISS